MRKVAFEGFKLKLLGSVMAAAMLSACSSDVSRFDDPFGNPFRGSSRFDSTTTGSVRQPAGRDMRKQSYAPVTTGSATTEALSAPNQSMPAASRPLMPASAGVQGLNPSAKASGFSTGVAAANYPTLAPVAQRSGTALASSAMTGSTGWSAVGGTPITLGQGETVTALSGKYGVPASAILAVNGLSPSSRLNPGQQLMIPAYSGAAQGAAARVAQAQAVAPVMQAKPVERVQEIRREVAPIAAEPKVMASEPKVMASERKSVLARPVGPVRQVGATGESDAEKRAAAKLRELNGKKPATRDEDDEDEAPAKKAVSAPKPAPAAKVEETRTRADKAEAEKARIDAEKQARAEAAKAKADAEKLRLAKLEKAKAEKADAEKLAKAEKAAKAEKIAKARKSDEEVTTTASIPAARVPERESAAPKLAKAEAKTEAKAEAKSEAATETASNDTFRWPAKGRVISGFGSRGSGAQNDGINIALPEGTPVRAAEGGVVVHADDALKGYGKMVLVRHPNGYISVYANNGDLNVKRGETVKRGQVIAHSGASGNVTSPQLHFELRKGSTPVDPTTRLAD